MPKLVKIAYNYNKIYVADTSMFLTSEAFSFPTLGHTWCPIGDYIHCADVVAAKRSEAVKLLFKIIELAAIDPQVAFKILHLCGAFCKLQGLLLLASL